MTYPLTPRQDRLRVLRARRNHLDALIQRLEEAERQDGTPYSRRPRKRVHEGVERAPRNQGR